MKKLFFGLIAVIALAWQASAANWTIQNFLSPRVAALIITNSAGGVGGVSNLNYIAQNVAQGTYQVGTNAAGTAINIPISTNLTGTMFTNNSPLLLNGQYLPGALIVLTNAPLSAAVVASNAQNPAIQFSLLTTNDGYSAVNMFQDVWFNSDLNVSMSQYATYGNTNFIGTSNALGIITIKCMNQPYPYTSNTLTNIVNVSFVGVPEGPLPTSSVPPGLGPYPPVEPSSFVNALPPWVVTFTNGFGASTVVLPNSAMTVYTTPVPAGFFTGMRGMRVRGAWCGGTGLGTNNVAIVGLTFSDWVP